MEMIQKLGALQSQLEEPIIFELPAITTLLSVTSVNLGGCFVSLRCVLFVCFAPQSINFYSHLINLFLPLIWGFLFSQSLKVTLNYLFVASLIL